MAGVRNLAVELCGAAICTPEETSVGLRRQLMRRTENLITGRAVGERL